MMAFLEPSHSFLEPDANHAETTNNIGKLTFIHAGYLWKGMNDLEASSSMYSNGERAMYNIISNTESQKITEMRQYFEQLA